MKSFRTWLESKPISPTSNIDSVNPGGPNGKLRPNNPLCENLNLNNGTCLHSRGKLLGGDPDGPCVYFWNHSMDEEQGCPDAEPRGRNNLKSVCKHLDSFHMTCRIHDSKRCMFISQEDYCKFGGEPDKSVRDPKFSNPHGTIDTIA